MVRVSVSSSLSAVAAKAQRDATRSTKMSTARRRAAALRKKISSRFARGERERKESERESEKKREPGYQSKGISEMKSTVCLTFRLSFFLDLDLFDSLRPPPLEIANSSRKLERFPRLFPSLFFLVRALHAVICPSRVRTEELNGGKRRGSDRKQLRRSKPDSRPPQPRFRPLSSLTSNSISSSHLLPPPRSLNSPPTTKFYSFLFPSFE